MPQVPNIAADASAEFGAARKKSGLHFCKPPKTRQQPTFALFCTIIGHVSLTVVFGMGTCVSSRV